MATPQRWVLVYWEDLPGQEPAGSLFLVDKHSTVKAVKDKVFELWRFPAGTFRCTYVKPDGGEEPAPATASGAGFTPTGQVLVLRASATAQWTDPSAPAPLWETSQEEAPPAPQEEA